MWYDSIIDSGIIPDFIMKQALAINLRQAIPEKNKTADKKREELADFAELLKKQPVALKTDDTKKQHYEVPTDFFTHVLGSCMKYSCCLWNDESASYKKRENLDRAETDMLALTAERAGVENGMRILDLGCGWGSLSLYLAGRFPQCDITAVSHSATQKKWIDRQAAEMKLDNINVITADMNSFEAQDKTDKSDHPEKYDRIISIEMFEHMRNWDELFARISRWLKEDGRFFMHVFTVEGAPYFFDADNDKDWMARNFFAGGMMPSAELPSCFPDHLTVEKTWKINGTHYAKTLLAWLCLMDKNKNQIMPVLESTYGDEAIRWWNRWRLFFLSSAVVFGYDKGEIWNVTHFLMKKSKSA
ncbi:MAG: cyclopropane-fatty-acyl-phospholipid synthase family protein [Spirochaetia bacterium]|jgi:cyclopropane-fatty-acyl-phospholipid synthase|nr:cyclopropane-fatty-acyl-phospholipid synthase family protein [Spirochaetia bacterium]